MMSEYDEHPRCPYCTLWGWVVSTELGYLCDFCGHQWPNLTVMTITKETP